jgi:hypothetical protein
MEKSRKSALAQESVDERVKRAIKRGFSMARSCPHGTKSFKLLIGIFDPAETS